MTFLRAAAAPLGALATLALLAGCGTTSDAADATVDDSAQAVTVTDVDGESVTLENGPAQRVVALEWAQAEVVTSLGVDLVGLTDVAGYESWVGNAAPLAGEPEEVGTRTEPSVERIAELEPDLIVGAPRSVPDEVRSQLEKVAPVLLLDSADAADPLGTVADGVNTIATATGTEDEAEDLLAQLDEKLTENAAAVTAAGIEGEPVVFASPYADGSNVSIRMHGPGSAVQAVITEMGLGTAWEDAGDEGYGLSYTDIEGLTALPDDTHFLYWANADEEDAIEAHLAGNGVWENLPFVQDGGVAGAAEGIWAYGGPESMMAFSDDVLRALRVS